MPKVGSKPRIRKKATAAAKEAPPAPPVIKWKSFCVSLLCGVIAGLSAPGINQWYLAWVGLVPFFLLTIGSPTLPSAVLKAFLFGLGFNLAFLNWYCGLHPLSWLGFADWQSWGITLFCLAFVTCQQAIIYGLYGLGIRLLPLCGGFLPRKVEDRWCAPALVVLPLLWCLIQEKIGNAPDLLGVPWSMIEYTQYQQTALIQPCSIIGGIGLAAVIVLANASIACVIATFNKSLALKPLAATNRTTSLAFTTVPLLMVAIGVAYGYSRLAAGLPPADQTVSIVQGNVNIEMQKTRHRFTLDELVGHYRDLMSNVPPGFCVLTESAVPTYFKDSPTVRESFERWCRLKKLDMIIGAIDREDGSSFNSAFGIDRTGHLLPQVYHKRFLVPVGEYKPAFLNYLPKDLQLLTDTPAGTGFTAGRKPAVLDFNGKLVAPMICFESISPELMVSSIRNGGSVLVNMSDLAWFHGAMIGDQALAISTFRAVESDRYFVYAANTGPSMIIDPLGRTVAQSTLQVPMLVTGKVGLRSTRTPFVEWFH